MTIKDLALKYTNQKAFERQNEFPNRQEPPFTALDIHEAFLAGAESRKTVYAVYTGTEVGNDNDDGYHAEQHLDSVYDNREDAEIHAKGAWWGEVRELEIRAELPKWIKDNA